MHRNDPDPKLLAYQYLQTLPQLAQGQGNTFWVIPSEVTSALQGVSKAFTEDLPRSAATREEAPGSSAADEEVARASEAAAEAVADAQEAESPNGPRQLTQGVEDPSVAFTDLEKEHQER